MLTTNSKQCWLLDGEVGGLRAFEDPINVTSRSAVLRGRVRRVTHEGALMYPQEMVVDSGQPATLKRQPSIEKLDLNSSDQTRVNCTRDHPIQRLGTPRQHHRDNAGPRRASDSPSSIS
jgi:hypothetical protein